MKRVLFLFMLAMLMLCSCGKKDKIDFNQNNDAISENIQVDINAKSAQITPDMKETIEISVNDDSIPIMQAFLSVMLNETTFSCTDESPYSNTSNIQQFHGFLNEIPYGYDSTKGIHRFSIVDLDGDAVPEIVLELNDYYGFIILRYKEGQIYGNVLGYRSMNMINKEGVFHSASSAHEGTLGKLYFIGNTIVMDRKVQWLIGIDNNRTCYIDDIMIDQSGYEKVYTLFIKTPEIEWHDYTNDAINKFVMEYDAVSEISKISMERQLYLDSLSYLIDLTYDTYDYEQKTPRQIYMDGKKYYDNCYNEMDKIYQLCEDRLSETARKSLLIEQQRWEESNAKKIEKILSENNIDSIEELEDGTIYFTYGDIVLRRILTLINIYYDCDYYDWIS